MTSTTTRSLRTLTEFAPDWITTPGETIADMLEERGWTQTDLANGTGFTAKHINLLLQGLAPLSEDSARTLERVLGSTARFWSDLETQYREHLARREAVDALTKHSDWLKELPLGSKEASDWFNLLATRIQHFEPEFWANSTRSTL
jgi:HTH-type transcriptional regulator/antitoxin HigA